MAKPLEVVRAESEKRLTGLIGAARIREVRDIIAELPNYKNGPYAIMRKELLSEIRETKTRKSVQHFDEAFILRKKGYKQIALVGFPNVGKSSLLNQLTGAKSEVANYAFTTLGVKSGILAVRAARIELVDLPGIIEGASENHGLGHRILGAIRNTDAIALVLDAASNPQEQLNILLKELSNEGITKPTIVLLNKTDLDYVEINTALPVMRISALTGAGLDGLKNKLVSQSGLITVIVKNPPKDAYEATIAHKSTVANLIRSINKNFLDRFKFATVRGKSAKFDWQKVGLDHILEENDEVELHLRIV